MIDLEKHKQHEQSVKLASLIEDKVLTDSELDYRIALHQLALKVAESAVSQTACSFPVGTARGKDCP